MPDEQAGRAGHRFHYKYMVAIGVAVVVIGLVAAGAVLVTVTRLARVTEEFSRAAECQRKFNEAYSQALRIRSAAAEDDRTALEDMVRAIATADQPGEVDRALADWIEATERNAKRRAETPIPELPDSDACQPDVL